MDLLAAIIDGHLYSGWRTVVGTLLGCILGVFGALLLSAPETIIAVPIVIGGAIGFWLDYRAWGDAPLSD
jgi:hypothetical protein